MMLSLLLTGTSGPKAALQILSLILVFVFVVALAYFGTKFVAKYQSNVLRKNSNVQVIESFRIANNKFIAIVKICDDFYALSVGKDEIHLIDKLDPDKVCDYKNPDTVASKKLDFKDILAQVKGGKERTLTADDSTQSSEEKDQLK